MADKSKTDKPEKKEKTIKVSKNLQDIISQVEKLTVLELADLVKALEEKFGVSAQAPVMAASAGPAAGEAGAEDKKEEKSEYEVVLASSGANKIGVIKALREINSELGLKEAKDLTESTPKPVKTLKKEEAEQAKKKLEEAGAQVELK